MRRPRMTIRALLGVIAGTAPVLTMIRALRETDRITLTAYLGVGLLCISSAMLPTALLLLGRRFYEDDRVDAAHGDTRAGDRLQVVSLENLARGSELAEEVPEHQ
jgi:hypothetical protein